MMISIARQMFRVGEYQLPDTTHPFPRVALEDFKNYYETNRTRVNKWIRENQYDAADVKERKEWVAEMLEKISAITTMFQLDSAIPRPTERIKQLYSEFRKQYPKG